MTSLRDLAIADLDGEVRANDTMACTLAWRQVLATAYVGDQLAGIRQLLMIALFVLGLIAGALLGGS